MRGGGGGAKNGGEDGGWNYAGGEVARVRGAKPVCVRHLKKIRY
jgi:hypothetical protein